MTMARMEPTPLIDLDNRFDMLENNHSHANLPNEPMIR